MPRRVGITTDPDTRRAYWQNQVVGFTNWRILSRFRSRTEAQAYETRYARRYGCQASANIPPVGHMASEHVIQIETRGCQKKMLGDA